MLEIINDTLQALIPKRKGKFDLHKDSAGKWRFNLVASNGEIIASSEAYESKAGAKNGIKSVRRTALTAVVKED